MGQASQHFSARDLCERHGHVPEPLPRVSLHLPVESGKTFAWRLAADSELRVHQARVWLTRIHSPYDYWLQPGDVIRLRRGECIWLTTDADAVAEVSLTSAYCKSSSFVARWLGYAASQGAGQHVPWMHL